MADPNRKVTIELTLMQLANVLAALCRSRDWLAEENPEMREVKYLNELIEMLAQKRELPAEPKRLQ